MGGGIFQKLYSRTTEGMGKVVYLYEYCYNTTYHMSIQMSPFIALYGYEAPNFMDLLLSDSRVPSAGDLL